jgi:hypothetical protein
VNADTTRPPRVPTALAIVGVLFILSGLNSILMIGWQLVFGHRFNIDLGVINLWVGLGLLRAKARWRLVALVMLWVGFAIAVGGLAYVVFGSPTAEATFFTLPLGIAARPIVIAFLVASFAVMVWQYRVLQRPDVRVLFERNEVTENVEQRGAS